MSVTCDHGHLARQCELCDVLKELALANSMHTVAVNERNFERARVDRLNELLQSSRGQCARLIEENKVLREALTRLRDCDWVISLPDRMDAVREIARNALEGKP